MTLAFGKVKAVKAGWTRDAPASGSYATRPNDPAKSTLWPELNRCNADGLSAAQPPPKPEDGLLNVFAQGAVPLRNRMKRQPRRKP